MVEICWTHPTSQPWWAFERNISDSGWPSTEKVEGIHGSSIHSDNFHVTSSNCSTRKNNNTGIQPPPISHGQDLPSLVVDGSWALNKSDYFLRSVKGLVGCPRNRAAHHWLFWWTWIQHVKMFQPEPQPFNGNSRILNWRYCTIQGHILWGYSLT